MLVVDHLHVVLCMVLVVQDRDAARDDESPRHLSLEGNATPRTGERDGMCKCLRQLRREGGHS